MLLLYLPPPSSAEEIDVFWLSERGTPEQLKEALSKGAKFNVQRSISDFGEDDNFDTNGWLFEYGETPLHRSAAYNHNPESIKFLIAQSLDVNAGGSTGNSIFGNPLTCAIRYKNLEAVKELLNAGADPNSQSAEGRGSSGSPFHIVAAEYKNNSSLAKNVIEALVKAGGNINQHYTMTAEDLASLREEEVFAKYRSIFMPRSKWSSDYPFDNLVDVSNASASNFLATLTPLMYAVLNDNPDVVNILLDAGADVNIRSGEKKTAFVYANEFFENSKLKKSPAFEKLKAAANKQSDTQKEKSFEMADSLVSQGKISMYVRDKGTFIYNPEISVIKINGKNVNLRSQPNTKSNVVAQHKGDSDVDVDLPYYLGEWIHPNGDRWVVGEFDGGESQIVWIFGKYAELLTEQDLNDLVAEQELIAQQKKKQAEQRGEELIEFVRNGMHYREFSEELGYGPVGKQCEKFFADGKWGIGTSRNKILFEEQCVYFKGIGKNWLTGRRYMFTIFFNIVSKDNIIYKLKKGQTIISQINQNDKVVYSFDRLSLSDAIRSDIQMYELTGSSLLSNSSANANEITLEDFLERIYSID